MEWIKGEPQAPKQRNFQYDKECLENGICPKCNTKLTIKSSISGRLYVELYCFDCHELYYPLEDPYNLDFDKIMSLGLDIK